MVSYFVTSCDVYADVIEYFVKRQCEIDYVNSVINILCEVQNIIYLESLHYRAALFAYLYV